MTPLPRIASREATPSPRIASLEATPSAGIASLEATPSPHIGRFTPLSHRQQRRRPLSSPLLARLVLPRLLFALLLATALGCSSSKQVPPGSETNWLSACTDQKDCRGESTCHCGICTAGCESNKDCEDVPGAATCFQTTILEDGSCFLEAQTGSDSDLAICVARCDTPENCGDEADFDCVQGICLSKEGTRTSDDGSVAVPLDFASDAPDALSDAAPTDPMDTSDASTQPDSHVADDGATDTSAAVRTDASGSISNGDAAQGISLELNLGPPLPSPFLTCPCTSDMPAGARAPQLGEVPPNAYGGPTRPQSDDHGPPNCAGIAGSWYVDESGEDNLCVSFFLCPNSCEHDDDCPHVDSGTAVARCIVGANYCYLDCAAGRTCPDGMSCWQGVDGASCVWPRDNVTVNCPAYCEQQPIPRDCPNWCASVLVACDPERDVNCCEGLICSEEKYCVQE